MFSKLSRPSLLIRRLTQLPRCPTDAYIEEVPHTSPVKFSEKWHRRLGPVFRQILASEGRYPVHLVPQAWTVFNSRHGRRRGLFFLDGEEWWQSRRRLNPLFLKQQSLARLHSVVEDKTEDLIRGWSCGDNVTGLEAQLYSWSTSTMLGILLGDNAVAQPNELSTLAQHAQQLFVATVPLMMVDAEEAAKEETEDWRDFQQLMERTLELTDSLVHRAMERRDCQGLIADFYRAGMTEDEVCRTIVDLLLAAVDTTSHTAAWALHTLASHPEVQAAIREEIELRTEGVITSDSVKRLPYLGGFIKEVMRLYPVAPFLTRLATQSFSLEESEIPAGTILLISLYVMGRDETIFCQPDTVLPQRWLREANTEAEAEQRRRKAFANLPFGHGARGCIGRRIAELELQLLVARVCQSWSLRSNNQRVEYTQRMVGVPDKPISFHLTAIPPGI